MGWYYLRKMRHPNSTRIIQRGHIPPIRKHLLPLIAILLHLLGKQSPRSNHAQIARHRLVTLILISEFWPRRVAPSVGTTQGGDVGVVGEESRGLGFV